MCDIYTLENYTSVTHVEYYFKHCLLAGSVPHKNILKWTQWKVFIGNNNYMYIVGSFIYR